jgi:hypothetical protein
MGLFFFRIAHMSYFRSPFCWALAAITVMLFAPLAAVATESTALTAPEQQVSRFYQAISTKDIELFRTLYAESERGQLNAERLTQRFSAIKSVTVERWLGTQVDDDLAHVAVSVRADITDDPLPEYNFAHHDFKRVNGQWHFAAVDKLTDAERARVRTLWQRQKTQMRNDAALKAHIEWIQNERQQAAQRRRARPVKVVD